MVLFPVLQSKILRPFESVIRLVVNESLQCTDAYCTVLPVVASTTVTFTGAALTIAVNKNSMFYNNTNSEKKCSCHMDEFKLLEWSGDIQKRG